MTATTAPRLRIDNGYKIWHYSLALLYERPWSQQDELYQVCWQPFPKGVFKEPRITGEKVEGIAISQPQASAEVYRPPSARNRPLSVGFKLHPDQPPVKPGIYLFLHGNYEYERIILCRWWTVKGGFKTAQEAGEPQDP